MLVGNISGRDLMLLKQLSKSLLKDNNVTYNKTFIIREGNLFTFSGNQVIKFKINNCNESFETFFDISKLEKSKIDKKKEYQIIFDNESIIFDNIACQKKQTGVSIKLAKETLSNYFNIQTDKKLNFEEFSSQLKRSVIASDVCISNRIELSSDMIFSQNKSVGINFIGKFLYHSFEPIKINGKALYKVISKLKKVSNLKYNNNKKFFIIRADNLEFCQLGFRK